MRGRPNKQNADYFSHENCMRNDRKVKALRAHYGFEGYGIYNMILESLSESDLIILKWSEMEIEMLAGDFGIETARLTEIVEYLTKINLLTMSNGYLFCPQLDERLRPIFDKRNETLKTLRQNKSINVDIKSINVSVKSINSSEIELPSRDSKVKKRKEKESKVLHADFVLLTEKEYQKLVDRFGNKNTEKCIDKLNHHIGAKGATYKSHYHAILKWVVGAVGARDLSERNKVVL